MDICKLNVDLRVLATWLSRPSLPELTYAVLFVKAFIKNIEFLITEDTGVVTNPNL